MVAKLVTQSRKASLTASFRVREPELTGITYRRMLNYYNPDEIRRNHLGSEHLNAKYVQCLTANILRPHVNDALHTETSANGSGGYSVLTSASLSNDPSFSNPSCKKYLRASVLS